MVLFTNILFFPLAYLSIFYSVVSASSNQPSTITNPPDSSSTAANTIPGLLSETCNGGLYGDKPPCVATCKAHDSTCLDAASSIVSTCKPKWDTFTSIQRQMLPTPDSWSWYTSFNTYSNSGSVRTTTLSIYTSFSTVTNYTYVNVYRSTITPVYALGKPILSESLVSQPVYSATYLTGPTPECRYNFVAWMGGDAIVAVEHLNSQSITMTCGQCSLYGGDVQLLWWPSPSTAQGGITSAPNKAVRTTVLDGTTLFSPTVYLSLHNLSASNSCSAVGRTIKQTLIGMDAADVSTLVHIGGKVAQSGANQYGPLNFQQLTGLPPVSQYEQQGECIYAGCATIYPSPINYTIAVPSAIRSMDPAWAECAAGLQGLYDPPIALEAQPTMKAADPRQSSHLEPSTGISPSLNRPKETWTNVEVSSTRAPPTKSLGALLQTGLDPGPEDPRSKPHRSKHTKDPGRNHLHSNESHRSPSVEIASSMFHGNTDPSSSVQKDSPLASSTHLRKKTHTSESNAHSKPRVHSIDSSQQTNQLRISTDSQGQYVVDGQIFAPGQPLTLSKEAGPATYRMLVKGGDTYIAIGTSTTVPFGTPTDDVAAMKFTRASDGNFVLHGTTLVSGEPITIGSGDSQTTLRMTTVHSNPAVIIDGTLTERLGHNTSSSQVISSNHLPVITNGPDPMGTAGPSNSEGQKTSSSVSGASSTAPGRMASLLIWVVILLLR